MLNGMARTGVQQHLDPATVQAVAMRHTGGPRRNAPVRAGGGPILAPVGEAVPGRIVNVMGEPVDHGPPFDGGLVRWPLHGPAPLSLTHLNAWPSHMRFTGFVRGITGP